ncbi:Nn.00g013340.m01.CDS01 [Neocucurbitaria sp. VM-36]
MLFSFIFAILYSIYAVKAAKNSSIVLLEGTGPYGVSYREYELVDSSRMDPFNASHVRRIMVSQLDPVPKSKCQFTKIPYFLPEVARAEDEVLSVYEYPTGTFSQFYLKVCTSTGHRDSGCEKEFPIALFSPGLNTTRLFYSAMAQEVASHGFTVFTIDHPYDTDVVVFPDGDVIFGGRVIKPGDANGSTASVEHALEVRAQDASFVLDTLGIHEQAVMFGQSFGGAATATAMLKDKRFRAGINIDGNMFGPVLTTPLGSPDHPQAFVLWGSDGHNSSSEPSWTTFWDTLAESPHVDYKREFNIINSSHGSSWDLNLLVDVADIRGNLSETAQLLIGPTFGPRVYEILGHYVSSLFSYALELTEEDDVLQGESEEFPDVELLNK